MNGTIEVTQAWMQLTKRAPQMVHGLVPSEWLVEINNDKIKRRVYEDWSKFRKGYPVPLIFKVKEIRHSVTEAQIYAGLKEAARRQEEWLNSLET